MDELAYFESASGLIWPVPHLYDLPIPLRSVLLLRHSERATSAIARPALAAKAALVPSEILARTSGRFILCRVFSPCALRFAGSARPGQKGDHKPFAEVKPRQVLRGRSAPAHGAPALIPRYAILE